MHEAKGSKTPMEPGAKLDNPTVDDELDGVPYPQLAGCLNYIALTTRPDISYAVSRLSKYNQRHGQVHWTALKRVLKYLSATSDYSLYYSSNIKDVSPIAWCDADWGSCSGEIEGRSYSGTIIKIGTGPISWQSKKQNCVALSSAESELISLSECCKEIKFLRSVMNELLGKLDPTVTYCDNQSAISLASNEIVNKRTRHINVRYFFCRESIDEGDVIVKCTYRSQCQ